jgi:hypothetical protein
MQVCRHKFHTPLCQANEIVIARVGDANGLDPASRRVPASCKHLQFHSSTRSNRDSAVIVTYDAHAVLYLFEEPDGQFESLTPNS